MIATAGQRATCSHQALQGSTRPLVGCCTGICHVVSHGVVRGNGIRPMTCDLVVHDTSTAAWHMQGPRLGPAVRGECRAHTPCARRAAAERRRLVVGHRCVRKYLGDSATVTRKARRELACES